MSESTYTAFRGHTRVATGPLPLVLEAVRALSDAADGTVLFFDHATGAQSDQDWATPTTRPGPGRPKLGVVSTEVTLLPRHWEWLNAQPARASGTLRRLVEDAMAREASNPQRRLEALGRILWAVAGNLPHFEEASRALYAGDRARLEFLSADWPGDLPSFVKTWT